MTYLNFLILFVILPAIGLYFLFRHHLNRRWWQCIGALCVVAVVWTTPWDNYLVASGVWWYDEDLVLNIIIGYVPLEEYAFFVLQTILTSILFAGILAYTPEPKQPFRAWSIFPSVGLVTALTLLVLAMLLSGEQKYNYLILELGWLALLPFATQWLFGLDIIVYRWKAFLPAVLIPTLWLTAMDSIAIGAGTWSISEEQTIGILLGGRVPIEEGIFFLITNLLIVQGMTLFYMPESWKRAEHLRQRWRNTPFRTLILGKKLNKSLE